MPFETQQTSVTYFPDVAIAGQLADTGFRDVRTGILDTDCGAGLAVVLGANGPQSVKLPGQSSDVTDKLMGFTVYDPMREPRTPRYAAKDCINVVKKGRLWVTAQGDTADQGPVYVVHSGSNAGQIRGDAGGGTATVCQRARVVQGATAGGLTQIEINLP